MLVEALAVAIISLTISLIGLLTAERAQVREDRVGPACFELVFQLSLLYDFLGALPGQGVAFGAEYRVCLVTFAGDCWHDLVLLAALLVELVEDTFALHFSHSRQLIPYELIL